MVSTWCAPTSRPNCSIAPRSSAPTKGLSNVERAFRSLKNRRYRDQADPSPSRSPACAPHVLLCMLAYYLEWHMRQALKSILFDDHDQARGRRGPWLHRRQGQSAPKPPSVRFNARRTDDDLPVHSFQSLIADFGHLHPQHHGDGRQFGDLPASIQSSRPLRSAPFGSSTSPANL